MPSARPITFFIDSWGVARALPHAIKFIAFSDFKENLNRLLKENWHFKPGQFLNRYQIIKQIGDGGMGEVYLANRADDEFRKRVAIKIIKRGMDSDFIVRRFRNERQILATLDHPNIARLLDGGTTGDGFQYFVMEYIEGEPIHSYCDSHRLPLRERLRLFQKVCSAVHYAHQNLVVHRDLKPGNILVTREGTPKLLDFGIAKPLNPGLAGYTPDPTVSPLELMTLEYASPEQVKGKGVDQRTDIFSLGCVVYKMLTGRTPFQSESNWETFANLINREPQPLSTFITNLPDELSRE